MWGGGGKKGRGLEGGRFLGSFLFYLLFGRGAGGVRGESFVVVTVVVVIVVEVVGFLFDWDVMNLLSYSS